jgi:ABC-type transport system involved in multi-copper enzyme maturation permease subunit
VNILHIARLQIAESIRRQVHLVTLFLFFILLASPSYVNFFALGQGGFHRISKDLGLTVIGYFAVFYALYFGSTVIPNDIERKTIYPLLARPISRLSYLFGQFLGATLLLAASLTLLGVGFFAALQLLSAKDMEDARFLWGVFAEFLSASVLLAVCMLFSTRSSPPLAGVLGAFVYIVGGLSHAFITSFILEDRDNPVLAGLIKFLQGLLPNFQVFQVKIAIVHYLDLPEYYMTAITFYALGWVLLLMLLGELSFSKKDL